MGTVATAIGLGLMAASAGASAYASVESAEASADAAEAQMKAEKEEAANHPTDASEAESALARDSEARKIRARKSLAGTVLTSPLGTSGTTGVSGAKLGVSG